MLTTVTVDIGTTSVKLCLFGTDGALVASARASTPTTTDAWGEIYDLGTLVGLVSDFVRSLEPGTRRSVQRLAITGVGESGGLVRPDLSLASPMILWHDHRGAGLLEALSEADRLRVYEVTGLPVNPNYGLSKAAWAVQHAEGDADGAQWLNVAEHLAALLTGERWSEYTLASRTMALDLRDGHWSDEITGMLGLDATVFPPLRTAAAGLPIRAESARSMGLSEDVRIHVAGHDHMVGGVGAGLVRGELLNSTGTTEGLLLLADAPRMNEATAVTRIANGIANDPADYTLFASIPTGGSAFATLQGLLGMTEAQLSASIADLDDRYVAGRIDLDRIPLVLPRFRGSPPPTKNAADRGVIAGIASDTTAEDLVLGCFLGMGLQFLDVLDLFGDRPEIVKVIGPASRNPLWLHLKADLLGTPLSVSGFPEVVSRGAQAIASGASGDWAATDPYEIAVDADRSARLDAWREDALPRWQHLKGTPA